MTKGLIFPGSSFAFDPWPGSQWRAPVIFLLTSRPLRRILFGSLIRRPDQLRRRFCSHCTLLSLPALPHCTPANTRHSPNAGTMLGQRRRRWPDIVPILRECFVFVWRMHTSCPPLPSSFPPPKNGCAAKKTFDPSPHFITAPHCKILQAAIFRFTKPEPLTKFCYCMLVFPSSSRLAIEKIAFT